MKKTFMLLLCAVLILSAGCSYAGDRTVQRLQISANVDSESVMNISIAELEGIYENEIKIHGLSDVKIRLASKDIPLVDAISSGKITVEELYAYARIDARNGYCTEEGQSYNGLSHFIYKYRDICDLYFCHDVYETPDGNCTILCDFRIYAPDTAPNAYSVGTIPDENGNPYPLDQEDWKLEFQIEDVSPVGFTLKIRQNSSALRQYRSQHIGQLYVTDFILIPHTEEMTENTDTPIYRFEDETALIADGTVTSLSVVFSESEGFPATMPSGSYTMCLSIKDEFDPDQVHPLMKDYHRSQQYWIEFKIP